MEIEIAGEKVHNPHVTYSSDRTGNVIIHKNFILINSYEFGTRSRSLELFENFFTRMGYVPSLVI